MTTTTQELRDAAVDALARALPSVVSPLSARHRNERDGALAAKVVRSVAASFVGGTSADIAIALADPDSLAIAAGGAAGGESPHVSIVDVLRPALESAAEVLGNGVLGEGRIENASALFADPEAAVFELAGDVGAVGWVAIRLRENGTVAGVVAPEDRSVVGKLGRINNVEMSLTVEIGRTRMSVRDLLALEPGAVIELDRSAGAPADILLNGRLIAHGEVVVVDQDYAVRITKILDVSDGLS